MSKIFISTCIFVFVLLLSSCSKSAHEAQQADLRIEKIKQLISQNKLNEAKSEIDSIHSLFPTQIDKRRLAVALKDTIILRESYKTLGYCNRILPQMKESYEQLIKNFVFEKNEKYDEFGKYVYKSQIIEQNTGRNYLNVELGENGKVFLISNYCGQKINHVQLVLNASGLELASQTNNSGGGILHSYSDGMSNFEILTFEDDSAEKLIEFISTNVKSQIKVTLKGSKQTSYILSENDKIAVSETYKLAKAKSAILSLEKQHRLCLQRIGKIKLLYNIK